MPETEHISQYLMSCQAAVNTQQLVRKLANVGYHIVMDVSVKVIQLWITGVVNGDGMGEYVI